MSALESYTVADVIDVRLSTYRFLQGRLTFER